MGGGCDPLTPPPPSRSATEVMRFYPMPFTQSILFSFCLLRHKCCPNPAQLGRNAAVMESHIKINFKSLAADPLHGGLMAGARDPFFSWGCKNVDMPCDCQNLGAGHRHIHPIDTKSWGQLAPCPPPPPAPGSRAPALFLSHKSSATELQGNHGGGSGPSKRLS